jgi:hypothetical protein
MGGKGGLIDFEKLAMYTKPALTAQDRKDLSDFNVATTPKDYKTASDKEVTE